MILRMPWRYFEQSEWNEYMSTIDSFGNEIWCSSGVTASPIGPIEADQINTWLPHAQSALAKFRDENDIIASLYPMTMELECEEDTKVDSDDDSSAECDPTSDQNYKSWNEAHCQIDLILVHLLCLFGK